MEGDLRATLRRVCQKPKPRLNSRGQIAQALGRSHLPVPNGVSQWGSYEVYERVKEYEAGVRARLKGLLAKRRAEAPLPAREFARLVKQTFDQARRLARSAVDRWVFLFHSSQHQDDVESRHADCPSDCPSAD
jgi:hypothetical protein